MTANPRHWRKRFLKTLKMHVGVTLTANTLGQAWH